MMLSPSSTKVWFASPKGSVRGVLQLERQLLLSTWLWTAAPERMMIGPRRTPIRFEPARRNTSNR